MRSDRPACVQLRATPLRRARRTPLGATPFAPLSWTGGLCTTSSYDFLDSPKYFRTTSNSGLETLGRQRSRTRDPRRIVAESETARSEERRVGNGGRTMR